MSGRYFGPVRFFYLGDESVARQYNGIARKLVGYLQNQAQLWGDNSFNPPTRRIEITNGAIISARKITDLIYNVYIDVRGVTKRFRRAFVYQFVYAADGDQLWSVSVGTVGEASFPMVGGLFVAVVFLVGEEGTDYAVFPILSTRNDVQSPEWEFIGNLWSIPYEDLVAKLPIPRHEVTLASSEHLYLPDAKNVAHASWMHKGARHYLAGRYTVAPIIEGGSFFTSGSLRSRNPQTDRVWTDMGYEASLDLYERPELVNKTTLPKGDHLRTAPDADWYSSYGRQRVVDDTYGAREFGIMIDASQTVHVWPIQAGTPPEAIDGTTGSPWASHAIKTNVDAQYVQSEVLSFPAGVLSSAGQEYRQAVGQMFELMPEYGDLAQGSSVSDLVRYVWYPSPDGVKYATIVEKQVTCEAPVKWGFPTQHEYGALTTTVDLFCQPVYNWGGTGTGDDTVPPWARRYDVRFERPVPAEVEIEITLTGPNLADFSIAVSPVTLLPIDPEFYPIQVRYSAENSFADIAPGDLLVGGFIIHTLDPLADMPDSNLEQHMDGRDYRGSLFSSTNIKYLNAMVESSAELTLTNWDSKTVERSLTANGYIYKYARYWRGPRYKFMDQAYAKLDSHWARNAPDSSIAGPMVEHLQRNFTTEGRFVVQARDGTVVFDRVIRRFLDNPLKMANWFTAQVASLDLASGSVVFGLCESTTYSTMVDNFVPVTVHTDAGSGSTYTKEDYTLEEYENESKRGHAIFWNGALIESSDDMLTNQMLGTLDSHPMSLETTFWGAIGTENVIIGFSGSPPPAPRFYNAIYWGEVWEQNKPGDPIGDANFASNIANGYVGCRDFPWGLEIGSWFYRNHYAVNRADKILANDLFFAYNGRYVDIEGPLITHGKDNSLKTPPTAITDKIVDVIKVGGNTFTHQQMVEEAFQITTSPARSMTLEFNPAYQVWQGNSTYDDIETVQVYTARLHFEANGTTDMLRADVDNPAARRYCNINWSYPLIAGGNYSEANPSGTGQDINTLFVPPFQSRAYSEIDVED